MPVEGYLKDERGNNVCPVHLCNTVCCRASHFLPKLEGPCNFLGSDGLCGMHKAGGIKAKPWGCAEYPRNQADIDSINRQAEKAGFSERCVLRIV